MKAQKHKQAVKTSTPLSSRAEFNGTHHTWQDWPAGVALPGKNNQTEEVLNEVPLNILPGVDGNIHRTKDRLVYFVWWMDGVKVRFCTMPAKEAKQWAVAGLSCVLPDDIANEVCIALALAW